MNTNFLDALRTLGRDAVIRVARAARPAAQYLFATILPERERLSYYVEDGSIRIIPTMAGLVGMDSPYPPGGIMDVSTFLEETAKIANSNTIPEKALREIQAMIQQLAADGAGVAATNERLVEQALNFLDKIILQPHFDTMEWLRGQALVFGAIDWIFNGIELSVDYQLPAANLLATRTGTDAYGGTTSKFWTDLRTIRRVLKYAQIRAIAHPETIDVILGNDANSMEVMAQSDAGVQVRRLIGANERASSDARDVITLIPYGLEGSVLDPANPKVPVNVPFMPQGQILFIATGQPDREFELIGEGATEDPESEFEVGYTHIAPTVEGNGRPGRWARLFTPEERPWQLRGEGVTNGLPVIRNGRRIAVASTEMPA